MHKDRVLQTLKDTADFCWDIYSVQPTAENHEAYIMVETMVASYAWENHLEIFNEETEELEIGVLKI